MADERLARLELKIAELEAAVRGVGAGTLDKFGKLASFSSGSCTNNCTAACTIGCTSGCTGGCAAEPIEGLTLQRSAASDVAMSGIERFEQLSKR